MIGIPGAGKRDDSVWLLFPALEYTKLTQLKRLCTNSDSDILYVRPSSVESPSSVTSPTFQVHRPSSAKFK